LQRLGYLPRREVRAARTGRRQAVPAD